MTQALSVRQRWVLTALTLVWGLNWPVMKLGISGTPLLPEPYPPLTFRALSMWLGLPLLALALRMLNIGLALPRAHWRETVRLAVPNMIVWHVVLILALPSLSSGRAAILGYTMPVFSALWGVALFEQRLTLRQWLGVGTATIGVLLLLWHEFARLAGAPLAAGAVVVAACVWAYGTHRMRRTTMPLATLTVAFWMTLLTAVVISALALGLEASRWRVPEGATRWSIAYNAVGVFAFAQAAWFTLARDLPPVASTISVMMIPVLGTVAGAWWLGEALHWQDGVAMALIVLAIAAVLARRGDR